ncbi:hypothetical protein HELRODRAFT_162364 [Helobdella robusta]|uniref:Uncharacterized protein n=1 Tax=Helobdella robusta TaxID=6412 RepID=T1ESK5_HELRO|nr:hypothetical protein HELRODRAFT_162364 [Helobdella robusta]ESN98898.1 hypothetical protein HELRODRAFT_162364 [Helobdella robusta]
MVGCNKAPLSQNDIIRNISHFEENLQSAAEKFLNFQKNMMKVRVLGLICLENGILAFLNASMYCNCNAPSLLVAKLWTERPRMGTNRSESDYDYSGSSNNNITLKTKKNNISAKNKNKSNTKTSTENSIKQLPQMKSSSVYIACDQLGEMKHEEKQGRAQTFWNLKTLQQLQEINESECSFSRPGSKLMHECFVFRGGLHFFNEEKICIVPVNGGNLILLQIKHNNKQSDDVIRVERESNVTIKVK